MFKKVLQKINYLGFTIAFLMFVPEKTEAQFNFSNYVPATPKSPNAAALGQYGDVPVSHYTGIPEIQIPIYTIKVGKFSIPVSLNYHAGGNKVRDYSSWVGTGWTLNAGGVINRQQRGIVDETMIDQYPANEANVRTILNSMYTSSLEGGDPPTKASDALSKSGRNGYDTESDLFYCSLPNDNTKFYMDVAGNAHSFPVNKLKIKAIGRTYANPDNLFGPNFGLGNNCFKQWEITDNQGNKFIYGATDSMSAYEASVNTRSMSGAPASINSWFLIEINLVNGQKISFNYEKALYQIPVEGDYTSMVNQFFTKGVGTPSGFEKLSTVRLTNIIFPGGKVEFVSGGYRADLTMDKVLDRINVYNQVNGVYNLLNTHKINTNNPVDVTPAEVFAENGFRLNLDSVVILDNNQKRQGAYRLAYLPDSSLPRNSNQDFWGYFCGKDIKSPLTYISRESPLYKQLERATGFAVNPAFAQFNILKSITYPTGGVTNFTFESNQVLANSRVLDGIGAVLNPPVDKTFGHSLENSTSGYASGFSAEFTVGNVLPKAQALISSRMMSYDSNPDHRCPVNNQCFRLLLYQKNPDGTYTLQPTMLIHNSTASILPNTTYKIEITWNVRYQGQAYVVLNWQEYPVVANPERQAVNIGGLRVKKIESIDPVTQTSFSKIYEYLTEDGISSGIIPALPIYLYNFPLVKVGNGFYQNVPAATSRNQSSIFNTTGSGVGYSRVTEYTDETGTLGKTVYTYTSYKDYFDNGVGYAERFPFPPAISYEWRRGKLLSKYVYVNKDNTYKPVSKTDFKYNFLGISDPNYLENTNIRIVNSFMEFDGDPSSPYTPIALKDFQKYVNLTEAYYTSSSTEELFDSQTYEKNVIRQTNNEFDNVSLENSSTNIPQSNGNTNKQQYRYASGYNSNAAVDDASLGIKNLILNNQVKAPVEQINVIQNSLGQVFVTGGSLFIYHKNKPLINKYYTLKLAGPILLSEFIVSSINGSGQFIYDSRYELNTSIDAYTTDFNAIQQTKYGAELTSYQWGYAGQYVTAQAMNTRSNNIFYESFEEGNGNSVLNDSRTGHYSYKGGYVKALSGLDNGNYTLTYWSASANVWSLKSLAVNVTTGTYTINLPAGQVDDIRFSPSAAQLTTYTYDPLIGITSSTDAKNQVSYYEYDSFQRLKHIKDKDGNIIKRMDYHFKG